jgi:hypothetical protein
LPEPFRVDARFIICNVNTLYDHHHPRHKTQVKVFGITMFGNTGFIQACGRTEVAVFRSAFNNRFVRRREEGKREREREREREERETDTHDCSIPHTGPKLFMTTNFT